MSDPTAISSTDTSAGATKSPDSDISPSTQKPRNESAKPDDYFSIKSADSIPKDDAPFDASVRRVTRERSSPPGSVSSGASTIVSPPITNSDDQKESGSSQGDVSDRTGGGSRKSSVASVSFRAPANPALPQGHHRHGRRQRSPSPERFRQHVAFDNIPVGEATKSNTLGYTLSVSHHGYHPRRRSRTVMVGVDQHVYSDFALQWLLEEYADDGDEIICVHVTDKDARAVDEKNYKSKAEAMVERIKKKIPQHRAISIKLEYAVGKLHATFQKLIQVYQPSMLVVGTRGRSLGGFQGLVNTNSFSKYCLQYSPIPTVVVRDYEKRQKKKKKRSINPSRHSYVSMLAANQGKHEADSENSSVYELESRLSPDEEAHRVAAAIGLPASFDPTLKPINLDSYMHARRSSSAPTSPSPSESPKIGPATPARLVATGGSTGAAGESDEEESGDEEEGEFEVIMGKQALQQTHTDEEEQKKRLHEMEVGEAAALLKQKVEDEEDEEGDDSGGGEGKT